MKNNLAVLCIALSLSGCASMGKSILFGAGVGAAAGTGTGLIVQKSAGSALIGLGIGSVIGGAIGYLFHKDKGPDANSANGEKNQTPSVTAPEVSRVWVPSKIEDKRFIDGHFEYFINKPSVWSK